MNQELKEQGKHLVKLAPCMQALKLAIVAVIKWMICLYLFASGTAHLVTLRIDKDRDLNAALNIRDKGILELKAAGRSSLLMEAA